MARAGGSSRQKRKRLFSDALQRLRKVGQVAKRGPHEREPGSRGPRPRTGSDPFEGTSRAVAGGIQRGVLRVV